MNDETLPLLCKMAVTLAQAGADVIAPSDMMDGRVGAIRNALDENGFTAIPVMSYSAKYASGYYSPFRDAAHSAPGFGDRKTYQMDPANSREAIREILADVEEGADMIIVKPAMSYMDILKEAGQVCRLPLAAYNVSGEYAMVKAAAMQGWIDENDPIFDKLRIWTKDANGKDILCALGKAGVGAIYLGNAQTDFSLNSSRDNSTNALIRKTGIFLYENGSCGTVQHVDLAKSSVPAKTSLFNHLQ